MSTTSTTSFDDTLGFVPAGKRKLGRPNFLTTLRIIAEGVREGLQAERRYYELTARGVAHADAARMVFAEHYQAR